MDSSTNVGARHAAVPLRFGAGARLFGWHHAPRGTDVARAGVVLVNPVGDDDVRAHRAMRKLAERLAAAGFAVLRFDFHGTGDSAGSEHEAARVRRWLGDVGAAVDELRARARTRSVSLVGLKLGGTLAAVAASERGDVDGVLLWVPHATGKAFVDEVTKLHRMHRVLEPQSFAAGPAARREGEEALGFFLTRETIADLGAIDLARLSRTPAPRVVLATPGPSSADLDLAARLSTLGADVTLRHVPPPRFLSSVPHETRLDDDLFAALVAGVEALVPPGSAGAQIADAPRVEPAATPPDELVEEPILFGADHPLFGVVTRPPAHAHREGHPGVVLLNAGTVHRVGPHRLYVPMARRWARLGFPVLRFDLSGIGDSPAPAGCEENLCYPRDGARDVAAALSALASRTGVRRFVLVGLCSGGDHAFRAALADARVTGVVILNPRTFGVRTEAVIKAHQHARYYEGAALRAESWQKLLRGEVDVARLARAVLPRISAMVRASGASLLRPRSVREAPTDVPASLRRLAERGVDTFVLASDKDPGIDYVDTHFGRGMRALEALPRYRRETVHGTDHTFTSLWAQRRVADLLTDHLTRRYLAAAR